MKYIVKVEGALIAYATLVIEADSEEEAREKASPPPNSEWETSGFSDGSFEILSITPHERKQNEGI